MKEYRRVFWDFSGKGGIKDAFRMLETLDLRHVAKQSVGVPRGRPNDLPAFVTWISDVEDSSGWVDLEVSDPRLASLRAYLQRAGIPAQRELALTRYSAKDYAMAPWLMGGWGSILPSSEEFGQRYDFRRACKECGAGAVASPPLIAKLADLKKAGFGTCWDGSLVTTAGVARAVEKAELSDVKFLPVRAPRKDVADPRYRYVQIRYTWPRAERITRFEFQAPCEKCGQAGHYEPIEERMEYQVRRPKRNPPDFGLTWEMWGGPLRRPTGNLRVTCGQPQVILSQRARRVIGEAVGSWMGKPITVLD